MPKTAVLEPSLMAKAVLLKSATVAETSVTKATTAVMFEAAVMAKALFESVATEISNVNVRGYGLNVFSAAIRDCSDGGRDGCEANGNDK
ncbi:hypothetical protein N9M66_00320 [Litoreibacter sp.]|nr:hypothetical protein [Litoreibacter sp.]